MHHLFSMCPRCSQRCPRVYAPTASSGWLAGDAGPDYASRTQRNDKDSLWGRGFLARAFWTTQGDCGYMATDDNRRERRRGFVATLSVTAPVPE